MTSTVAHNSATVSGSGIHHLFGYDLEDRRLVTLENSLLAENSGGNCGGDVTEDPFISRGHNLSDDGSCIIASAGDITKVPAQIGTLQDNGGDTVPHALLEGSPGIDAGSDTNCPTTDQRGIPRPQGARCDIGAFEYVLSQLLLYVSPAELQFTSVAGAASPAPQTFSVENSGAGSMAWTASVSLVWLDLNAASCVRPL